MAVLEAPPEAPAPSPEPGPARILGRHGLVLVVAGTVFAALAMLSLWTWRTFASSQGFADVATDMLRDEAVRETLANIIVDNLALQEATADLALNRPLVEEAVELAISTDAFQGVFHVAVRNLHATLANGVRKTFRVESEEAVELVQQRIAELGPTITSVVPPDAAKTLVSVSESVPLDTTIRMALIAGWLSLPFALIAFACLLSAVLGAYDRRRAVEIVGWCLVGLGGFTWTLLHVLGGIASRSGSTELEGNAIRAVFWSVTNLLSIQSTVAITAGAVMVVAGAYAGTTTLRTRGILLWEAWWRKLERPGWKALASITLLAVAAAAMVWPAGAAAVVMRTIAFIAFVAGAVALLDLIGSRHWTASPTSGPIPVAARRVAVGGVAFAGATCALVFFGGMALVAAVRAPTAKHGPMSETGCNGEISLCDRRLDEVTLAGTHNSMATASDDFNGYTQQRSILGQLGAGVRVLLVDLHYGQRIEDMVRTDVTRRPARTHPDDRPLTAEELEKQAVVDRAMSVVGLRASDGESELYLCHLECALGHRLAVDTFREIHGFLRQAPNNVLLIIVQDEVDATDAVEVFHTSGLARRAYAWTPGTPPPTLREMIEQGRNVLIMAEHRGGTLASAPWYHSAYGTNGLLQETRFKFTSLAELSCERNRGSHRNPLFLLNHWVEGTNAVEAGQVNDESVLTRRIRQCEAERDRPVNIVAVDHAEQGDLFEVVKAASRD